MEVVKYNFFENNHKKVKTVKIYETYLYKFNIRLFNINYKENTSKAFLLTEPVLFLTIQGLTIKN